MLVAVSVAALSNGAAAQYEPRGHQCHLWPARADHDIQVTIQTVDEEVIRGPLVALSLSDGAVVRRDDVGRRHIPTRDLVRVTMAGLVPTRQPKDLTLALTGGDVLHGRVVEGNNNNVVMETVDLGRVHIPLDSIERLCAARAYEPGYRESAAWFDRSGHADADRILLTNGDVADGFITAIDHDGISIEATFGETLVPHRLVVAARLASTKSDAHESRGHQCLLWPARAASTLPADTIHPRFRVTLRTAGRLTMTGFDWTDGVVEADLRCGGHAKFEASHIVGVDVIGGRWEWLSSHRPISYEHTPMLSLDWDYARDRNVLGGPIRVAGQTFEHGVGVHSRSSLTYDLRGAYGEFVTSFGIDDDSGPCADVSVFILVDGKRRLDQAHVCRGELFGPIRLDVSKANRIELIVDFGDSGDLQDRFNWVEAALIR